MCMAAVLVHSTEPIINPQRRIAQRGITVIGLSVCVCVCVCVSESNLALQATRRLMSDTRRTK